MRHTHSGVDDHGKRWAFIHSHVELEEIHWHRGLPPEVRHYFRRLRPA